MAESQIGRAVVFGIDGTMQYEGVAATGNEVNKISYEDQVNRHEHKDRKGAVVGLTFFNRRKKLTIDFYPCAPAGDGAIALAAENMALPAPGARVTIEGMAGPDLNSENWIYEGGGTREFTNEAEVKMKLTLMQYETDISTPST